MHLYDEEEGIQQIAKLCMMVLEWDREYQREKLETAPQYCFYCKKQITALNDLYTYDDQNCCAKCGKKILKDPTKPKTFCGFPVVKTTDSTEKDI